MAHVAIRFRGAPPLRWWRVGVSGFWITLAGLDAACGIGMLMLGHQWSGRAGLIAVAAGAVVIGESCWMAVKAFRDAEARRPPGRWHGAGRPD